MFKDVVVVDVVVVVVVHLTCERAKAGDRNAEAQPTQATRAAQDIFILISRLEGLFKMLCACGKTTTRWSR
jgi:hypothetical protein